MQASFEIIQPHYLPIVTMIMLTGALPLSVFKYLYTCVYSYECAGFHSRNKALSKLFFVVFQQFLFTASENFSPQSVKADAAQFSTESSF